MAEQAVKVELFYSGQWNDHTSSVLVRDGIEITWGQRDEQTAPSPATCKLTFTSWEFNPHNPTSALSGLIGRNTPIRVSFPVSARFVGEVSSWTPRQSLGGPNIPPDRWVEVEATDPTRRLGQGADPLEDALRRYLTLGDGATNLVGYWPMTGGDGIRSRAAVVGGTMRQLDEFQPDLLAQFHSGDLVAPWLPAGTALQGTMADILLGIAARGAMTSVDTTQLTVDAAFRYTSGNLENRAGHLWVISGLNAAGEEFSMDLSSNNFDGVGGSETDPQWRWEFRIGDFDSPSLYEFTTEPHAALADGRFHVARFTGVLNAAANEIDWTVYLDGEVVFSGTTTSVPLNTIAVDRLNIVTFTINPAAIVYGPIAVWAGTPPDVADSLAAFRGLAGEHAGRRIERLCDEQGVTFTHNPNLGDLDDTQPCGPQYPDGFLAILRETATVDRGWLTGARALLSPALEYRPGRSAYSQAPVLELDYDAAEVAPPLDPVIDDLDVRNDVTVTRRDGGQVRAVDEQSVAAVGRYQTSVTLNTLSDGHSLESQAGWLLHLGAAEGTRFPRVTVDLTAAGASLAALAAAVRPGDLIAIANLPAGLTPDLAQLLVLGYTETIGSHTRRITYNCVPAAPYRVADPEGGVANRVGFSALWRRDGAVDSTATAITLRNEEGPDVTFESDFDIVMNGERMTVTGIGSWSGTYPNRFAVFTVVRSVNGVVKSHPDDSRVRLADRAYIGL